MIKNKVISVVFIIAYLYVAGRLYAQAMPEMNQMENPIVQSNIAIPLTEDLMREHGILERLLLIYEEIATRLDYGMRFSPEALIKTTRLIRDFMQDYHERYEKAYLFDKFRQADKSTELVKTFEQYHKIGRNLIDEITLQAKSQDHFGKYELAETIRRFVRVCRAHKAHEETLLFPSIGLVMTDKEHDEYGKEYEKRERELLDKNGFTAVIKEIDELERMLKV